MVRRSVPDSSRWTANAWRRECGVIALPRPDCSSALSACDLDGARRDGLLGPVTRKQPLLLWTARLPVGP